MTREKFIVLVQSEQEALRGFLLALCCGNQADADDIAQDAFVKAYLSSESYREKGKFRSWLFKIAHNTFINHKVSSRTFESIEETKEIMATSSADSSFHHQELYLALGTLPAKERSAIVMYYMHGYSIKEIAAITDISEDAIKKQLSRGRDRLKEKLKL
jgi:RNA polymerase sigma-70 factor (ECF subfamily)